jgi:protein-S-isoprenylcysteine O-methyltransferase Ste14
MGAVGICCCAVWLHSVHAAMGANWTPFISTSREQTLITTGPFALVRHPMYSCAVALAVCVSVGTQNTVVALAWTLFALAVVARVPTEERALHALFRSAEPTYAGYSRTVRWRVIPFLW